MRAIKLRDTRTEYKSIYLDFEKFIKWQNSKTNGFHRYHLTITVENITKSIRSHHEYAAAWCEISTEKGFTRSEVVPLDEFQGKKLHFVL